MAAAVVAEAIGNSPSPKPNSVPWLLLRARATSGNGLFTHVQFIQRLNTVGGSVPRHGMPPRTSRTAAAGPVHGRLFILWRETLTATAG